MLLYSVLPNTWGTLTHFSKAPQTDKQTQSVGRNPTGVKYKFTLAEGRDFCFPSRAMNNVEIFPSGLS